MRKTKIICTLGPATDREGVLRALVENGMNVGLTIDYGIQSVAESALKRVAETYSPASAECIVLDPDTFEILAMAGYPAYDLNEVPRDDTELLNSLSRNRIVCDIYEPGSTFKIVTAAADLEEWLRGKIPLPLLKAALRGPESG